MKKYILLVLLALCATNVFPQDFEEPAFLAELTTGYAFGINLQESVPVEIKLVYPIFRFGLTLESGVLLGENNGFHFFLGPTFFVINNSKVRVPLSIGLDLCTINENLYYGIGGIISFNYVLHKNIYAGANLSINYNFNNPYEEVVRIETKDAAIGIDPETGNKIYPMDKEGKPILETRTPIKENRNHFGNYIYIKPSISIGFQF